MFESLSHNLPMQRPVKPVADFAELFSKSEIKGPMLDYNGVFSKHPHCRTTLFQTPHFRYKKKVKYCTTKSYYSISRINIVVYGTKSKNVSL